MEEDKVKWLSRPKANVSVIDKRYIEFCIKLEEVQ